MTEDLLHVSSCDSGVAWTTGNIGEAFPGVCTPLEWTFLGPTIEIALRRLFRRLGVLRLDELRVPATVEERFCAPFHGRMAVNVSRLREIADRMPAMSSEQVQQQLLGDVHSDVATRPTRGRYPAILTQMPGAVVRLLPTLRRLRADLDR